jgi:hypothetical protein
MFCGVRDLDGESSGTLARMPKWRLPAVRGRQDASGTAASGHHGADDERGNRADTRKPARCLNSANERDDSVPPTT